MARFKYERNLQSLARGVGSTCHDGLLLPGMWDLPWRAPRGVGHPETHPHTRDAVVYAEYSSRTLAPGLQLCKECTYPTLWATAQRWVVGPFFAVSRFQGSFDQPQEAVVLDVFSENVHQDGMVDISETPFDVSFDEPLGPLPDLVDLFEGRVASPVRSESVAMFGEWWFLGGFQDGASDVLHHFIRPYRQAEWPFSPFGLV